MLYDFSYQAISFLCGMIGSYDRWHDGRILGNFGNYIISLKFLFFT